MPFRFVLVGSGNIGGTYAQAIANLDEAALCGLVSRSGRHPDYLPAKAYRNTDEAFAGHEE